jgi:hypothetical protein
VCALKSFMGLHLDGTVAFVGPLTGPAGAD